jgi:S-DNA-T family DNA segregation ATPase FtsK/SpoIIIE
LQISPTTAQLVVGGALLLLGATLALAVVFPGGAVADPLAQTMRALLGWGAALLPLWLGVAGGLLWMRVFKPEWQPPHGRLTGLALTSLALPGVFHLVAGASTTSQAGGLVGLGLTGTLREALGPAAATLLLVGTLAAGLMLLFAVRLEQLAAWGHRAGAATGRVAATLGSAATALAGAVAKEFQRPRYRLNPDGRPSIRGLRPATALVVRHPAPPSAPRPAPVVRRTPPAPAAPAREPAVRPRPTSARWELPPIDIFHPASPVEFSQADLRQRVRIIEETLASFNIEARVVEVNQGPAVTQFGLEPALGVTVSRIVARANDLALRLGAAPIRIEAPVPGKRIVGVEVPNAAVSVVSIREVLESPEFEKSRARLRLALGRSVTGRPVIGDLTRMPHLLIAGATGSGKSMCINSIICCLLAQCTPDELQLLLVDPKMVELAPYSGIPHLRMPVVTEMDKVVGTLKWALQEMERRYRLFVGKGVRDLAGYNRAVAAQGRDAQLPYLVVVIDELADLMMTAADEVERILCRLAQLARATGIHLVLATQRPSVDVVTGLIKANFPTRIAFAVTSQVDSRVILDEAGAERLLGRGDMLYKPGDALRPARLQGTFISDEEVHALADFWRRQGGPRYTPQEVEEVERLARSEDEPDGDDLFDRAVELVRQHQRVSTSLLQRRLGIGYPRAARLMDQLEERGIVRPTEDGRFREVVESAEDGDDDHLDGQIDLGSSR